MAASFLRSLWRIMSDTTGPGVLITAGWENNYRRNLKPNATIAAQVLHILLHLPRPVRATLPDGPLNLHLLEVHGGHGRDEVEAPDLHRHQPRHRAGLHGARHPRHRPGRGVPGQSP